MTLAIKIGAGSQIYDNIATAYAMRGYQKLSITGSGVEIKNSLALLTAKADGISSIKATSDILVTADEVTTNKAALLKLGTKSLVLQNAGTELASAVNTNFKSLDSVYTKFKSMNIATVPDIDITKISGAVNFVGMENLSGKVFTVTGSGANLKDNMSSILKNINQISQINLTSGTAELTADQLRVIGDKINKSAGATVLLKDTANNLLTTTNLSLINKYNNTNINPVSRTVTAGSASTTTIVTTAAVHGLNTGDAVTYDGVANGTGGTAIADGGTYYVRKLSDTTFSLYLDNASAIDTGSYANLKIGTTGQAIAGTFTTQAGVVPNRVTTLNDVQVTSATVSQAKRLDELTTLASGSTPNRLIANIISKVDIADSVANLTSGSAVAQAVTSIASSGTTAQAGIITLTGHGYSTGDAVTYSTTGTAATGLTNNTTYYVGKETDDTFVLFQNKSLALLATGLTGATNTNHLQVSGAGTGTHSFSGLPTGADVSQTMTSAVVFSGALSAASTGDGVITLTGHGYNTGDAVTYSSTGTAMGGLTSGTTYYVGKLTADTFALFATRPNALSADLSLTGAALATTTGFTMATSAGTGSHKFTNSSLDSTMSAVSRFKDGTGAIGRVTILGKGSINITDLNRISAQADRGGSTSTKVAYSALGVDVNKNLQALYDNNTAGTAIDEIVVSDGTSTGKKAVSLSYLVYGALKNAFRDGVDNPAGTATNKNYAFTVSGATFGSASTLQADENVATYAITGATYNDLTNPNTALATQLGRSKLKTVTSVSISDSTQRTYILSLLNALGNPVDRAKLKLTA